MDYWILLSFIIKLLLAMGLAQDHDRESDSQFTHLEVAIDIQSPESVIGATFHKEQLLVYSMSLLTIIEFSNVTSRPQYKYISSFHPRKLVTGFTDDQLLMLSPGQHCIRHFTLANLEVTSFSGNCQESGFTNGDAIDARYNLPSDMEKAGEHFYVADYNNDCIRRLWNDGYVRNVIAIHSKPFELAGSLFVAAHKTTVYQRYYQTLKTSLFKVTDNFATYVQFVSDVNVTNLESCSPDTLTMLTADKCLQLLPIYNEASLHPARIEGGFHNIMCHKDMTIATKLISSSGKNNLTMQIYSINTKAAVGLLPSSETTAATTVTPLPSSASYRTTRNTGAPTTKSPSRTTITTSGLKTMVTNRATKLSTTARPPADTTSREEKNTTDVLSSNYTDSFGTTEYSTLGVQEPLHNHAHYQFAHLPKGYSADNNSWTVVVPVTLAVVTIVAVLTGLGCIVYKRSKTNVMDENSFSTDNETTCNLIPDDLSQDEPPPTFSSQVDCRFYNVKRGTTSEEWPPPPQTNGFGNGHSFLNGNGVPLSIPSEPCVSLLPSSNGRSQTGSNGHWRLST